jgi:hypothetical protein
LRRDQRRRKGDKSTVYSFTGLITRALASSSTALNDRTFRSSRRICRVHQRCRKSEWNPASSIYAAIALAVRSGNGSCCPGPTARDQFCRYTAATCCTSSAIASYSKPSYNSSSLGSPFAVKRPTRVGSVLTGSCCGQVASDFIDLTQVMQLATGQRSTSRRAAQLSLV